MARLRPCTLDPKTVALLRVGASVAIGTSAVCLEWSAGRAMAAGASEDEIVDVLLAIVPVAGLGRVVSATPDLATALGYDISRRAGKLNDHLGFGSSWRPLRLRPSGADVHPRPRIHFRCEPWMQGLAAASFGMCSAYPLK